MWNYLRKSFKVESPSQLELKLSEIGKEGWEIIYYKENIINRTVEVDILAKKPSV